MRRFPAATTASRMAAIALLSLALSGLLVGCASSGAVSGSSSSMLIAAWLFLASIIGTLVGCGGPTFSGGVPEPGPLGAAPTPTPTPGPSPTPTPVPTPTPALPPTKVVFGTQPGQKNNNAAVQAGRALPPFTVLVQDVNGTTVSGATNAITVSLDPSTPGGVQLFGTLQVNAVNGVATFSDVHVTPAGAGFVLAASATGLTPDRSVTFEVNPLATAFATLRRDFAEGFGSYSLFFNEDTNTLAKGHFTNSGHLDLVATNSMTNQVTVLIGNGDGTYKAPVSFALGATNTHPTEVVTADFNEDGFDDIAVGCEWRGPAGLYVLLSNGDGTFQSPAGINTWVRPSAMTVADLGDKHQSLVIAGRDGNVSANPPTAAVLVLHGNGDGTFATNAPVLNTPTFSVRDVVAGPLTASGNVDIVAVGQGGISVMLGNGDGTFAAPSNYAVAGLAPICATLAPQQQGAPNAIYVADSANQVSLLAGNGDGTFQAPLNQAITGKPGANIVAGDFDGDTVTDAVVGIQNSGGGIVVAVQGNISSGFSNQLFPLRASGPSAKSVVMGDLNEDGKIDLASLSGRTVTSPSGPPTTHPLLGGVVSVFLTPVSGPASVVVPSDTNDQASADLDGDGAPEIVTTYPANSLVSVLHGNTDGSFSALANISLPGAAPSGVKVGDFNNDGKPDLAVQLSLQSKVAVLLGNGNGTFQAPQNLSVPVSGNHLVIGDVDGDKKADIITANWNTSLVSANVSLSVLRGNGDGTFQAATNFGLGRPWNLVATDLNNDGKLDIAAVTPTTSFTGVSVALDGTQGANSNLSVYLGNGDGTFQAATNYRVAAQPYALAAGDLDHDGNVDLVIPGALTSQTTVMRGNGDGTFKTPSTLVSGFAPYDVALADMNYDGNLDIVLVNKESASVSTFFGNGDGTFPNSLTVGGAANAQSVSVGDFNRDGLPDISAIGFGIFDTFFGQ